MLKIAYNKNYIYPLEENHRFPMIKYELIPEQLVRENTCTENNFFNPEKVDDLIVLLTHEKEYFERFKSLDLSKKEIREIGFPLSKELVEREMEIAEGTIRGVHYSIKHGISMNIAGGTHHAFYNRGEAFCMLNDQGIAANYILNKGLANRVMIIDLDVHQGNGTAALFNNTSNVFTLSFHGKNNYPFRKEISDLDVEFNDNTNDDEYLKVLKETIPRAIEEFKPDFIFYLSGVDVLENDKLGRLSLSLNGCKERDRFILDICKKNSIPVQVSMGGGYSVVLKNIIEAHSNTFRLAQEIFF
ncbi:MAG: histone deacetylase [Cryomorphaceae bacterium]|jgi:acetoin utilization deacetylase AcuC-like enzyme|nr:histone deacetylase [Cryomorphaceae bacterium]MBT7739431.1 histone deacetylase [Cryomorphaceae bacterium]